MKFIKHDEIKAGNTICWGIPTKEFNSDGNPIYDVAYCKVEKVVETNDSSTTIQGYAYNSKGRIGTEHTNRWEFLYDDCRVLLVE